MKSSKKKSSKKKSSTKSSSKKTSTKQSSTKQFSAGKNNQNQKPIPKHKPRVSVLTKETLTENVKIIDKQLAKYAFLSGLEEKTGFSKLTLALGLVGSTLFVLVFGLGLQILGHLIALVWPGYRSFLVIDALDNLVNVEDQDQHVLGRSKQDLMEELDRYKKLRLQFNMPPIEKSYDELVRLGIDDFLAKEKKVLVAKCNEKITRYLMYWIVYGLFYLAEYVFSVLTLWIPFYWIIKLGFLYWCGSPRFHGAEIVYKNVFSPLMNKHHKTFESWVETGQKITQQTVDELKDDTAQVFQEHKGLILDAGVKLMGQVGQMQANLEAQKKNS